MKARRSVLARLSGDGLARFKGGDLPTGAQLAAATLAAR